MTSPRARRPEVWSWSSVTISSATCRRSSNSHKARGNQVASESALTAMASGTGTCGPVWGFSSFSVAPSSRRNALT